MKIWFKISCLAVALVLAGCVAPEPYQKINDFDQKKWNSIMVPEPSGQDTNMQIWADMQGG